MEVPSAIEWRQYSPPLTTGGLRVAADRQNSAQHPGKSDQGGESPVHLRLGLGCRLHPAAQHDLENFLYRQFENREPTFLMRPPGNTDICGHDFFPTNGKTCSFT